MAFGTERVLTGTSVRYQAQDVIDQGLRRYMLNVYNLMGAALALSGIAAIAVAQYEPLKQLVFGTPLVWVVMLAPIGLVLVLSFGINRLSYGAAQGVFWAFATLMGASLASLLIVFTGASIARAFFATAATFGAMSLYGYTTKRDLTAMGSFLMMGLFGIVIASLVNMFIGSSALQFAITVLSVLIFTGLTAYDTQKIKEMYLDSDVDEVMSKKALMGALTLYLDFINIFVALVQLFGEKRE
jgi:FtsH-binding integral membrane protein